MELHNCRQSSRMICCWSFRAEAFGTERVSEWRIPWGGEDFGVVLDRKCLRDGWQLWEGRMWRRLRDGLWELWMSQGNSSVVWTRVIILVWVKSWPIHFPFVSWSKDVCKVREFSIRSQYVLSTRQGPFIRCFLVLFLLVSFFYLFYQVKLLTLEDGSSLWKHFWHYVFLSWSSHSNVEFVQTMLNPIMVFLKIWLSSKKITWSSNQIRRCHSFVFYDESSCQQ